MCVHRKRYLHSRSSLLCSLSPILVNRFLIDLQQIKDGGVSDDFSEFAADMKSVVFAVPQMSQTEVPEPEPTFSRRVMGSFSYSRTISHRGPDATNLLSESPTTSNGENSVSSSPADQTYPIQEVCTILSLSVVILPNFVIGPSAHYRLKTPKSTKFRSESRHRRLGFLGKVLLLACQQVTCWG